MMSDSQADPDSRPVKRKDSPSDSGGDQLQPTKKVATESAAVKNEGDVAASNVENPVPGDEGGDESEGEQWSIERLQDEYLKQLCDLLPDESESNKEKLCTSFKKLLATLKDKNPREYESDSFREDFEESVLALIDCETSEEAIEFHQDKLEEIKFLTRKKHEDERKKAVLQVMRRNKKKTIAKYSKEEISKELRRVSKEIQQCLKNLKKCEKSQLSLDELDEDTTPFVYHEKFAKKLKILWKQWCDLRGYQYYTGRSFHKPYKLNKSIGTVPEALRKDLESVITQYFQTGEVPDFNDVQKIIKVSVEKNKLDMTQDRTYSLSKTVHQDLINVAKIRRERDRQELFDLISTEEHLFPEGIEHLDAPGRLPPEVEKKFEENKASCGTKLEMEFKKWEEEQAKIPEEKLKDIRENGDPEGDAEDEEDEEEEHNESEDGEGDDQLEEMEIDGSSPKSDNGTGTSKEESISTPPPSNSSISGQSPGEDSKGEFDTPLETLSDSDDDIICLD